MKNIVILATGGTIAGKGEAGKTAEYKPGEADISEIIKSVPGIECLANITGRQVLNTASDNVTDKDMINLAKTINQMSGSGEADGFVITHGTDTLEETAYFLNLTAKTDKPIVMVGSMRPATALSADGPLNLYQAVALAASDEARGKGVLICFADGIFTARDTQKTNTFRTDAFSGRDLGCIGYMRDEMPLFFHTTVKAHTVDTVFDVEKLERLPKVSIAYFHLDADPQLLRYALDNSEGVVIASAGNGGTSSLWGDVSKEEKYSALPTVISSRIGNGVTNIRKSNKIPQNISSGSLNPQKAAILLRLALTVTRDIEEIKAIFAKY